MPKFSYENLVPGSKYKLIIVPETSYGVLDVFPAIEFVVPTAPLDAKLYAPTVKKINAKPQVAGKTKLRVSLPTDLMKQLSWSDTVRDIAHLVYVSGVNQNNIKSDYRYVVFGDTLSSTESPITMTATGVEKTSFEHAMWESGHPKVYHIWAKNNKYYKFQFVIARYILQDDGSWSGDWIKPNSKLKNRISDYADWN